MGWLPIFASAFAAFLLNLTAIGYFQSVEKALPSIIFALLRGVIFLAPAFLLLPAMLGTVGIWAALATSETLTSIIIVIYTCIIRRKTASKA